MSSVGLSTTNPSSGSVLAPGFVYHLECEKRQEHHSWEEITAAKSKVKHETAKPGEKDGSNRSEVES